MEHFVPVAPKVQTLLFRYARGGLISKKKLEERFADFARGEWLSLLEASRRCAEVAATGQRRRRRGRGQNNVEESSSSPHIVVVCVVCVPLVCSWVNSLVSPPGFGRGRPRTRECSNSGRASSKTRTPKPQYPTNPSHLL